MTSMGSPSDLGESCNCLPTIVMKRPYSTLEG